MNDKDLFALYEEVNELRRKLAHMEAVIRRAENDLWSKHQAERDAFIRAQDNSLDKIHHPGTSCRGLNMYGQCGCKDVCALRNQRTAPPSAALGSVEHGSGG